MQLYSFFNSSASYRVRIALELKKLNHILKTINIRQGEQQLANYLELNPIGLVPTLADIPEGSIGQSLAIIDYLDRQYPEPLLIPQESQQRTLVLEIAYAIACDIHPINNMRVLRYLSDVLQVTPEQKQAWYAHWVQEGLQAVEELLTKANSSQFCIGETPTIADCCLIPQIANALRMKCDLSAYKRCMQVYEHCLTLPAFQAAAPEKQPDYMAP